MVEEEVAAAGLEAALQEVCIHGDEVECGGRKEEGREMLLLPSLLGVGAGMELP
jgi:hypothetical protein